MLENFLVGELSCWRPSMLENFDVGKISCWRTFTLENFHFGEIPCQRTLRFENFPVEELSCRGTSLKLPKSKTSVSVNSPVEDFFSLSLIFFAMFFLLENYRVGEFSNSRIP